MDRGVLLTIANVCVKPHRRNKISAAAHSKWAGNDSPKFQRNQKMQDELNELVDKSTARRG